MNGSHRLYLLHALTPLHVGTGDAVGAIDLPTLRERHTGFPLLPGSSVKGVLREAAELAPAVAEESVRFAFGPPRENAGDHRGGLVLTDAHLLALPVRSLCGTFGWVTCGEVLRRLRRDLEVAGIDAPDPVPAVGERAAGLLPTDDGQKSSALLVPVRQQVFLEELLLTVEKRPEVTKLAEWMAERLWPGDEQAHTLLRQRLLVVHDDVFAFFTRVGLEVRSRVKIDPETGTAAESGPWAEEHIPAEALLWGLAMGRTTLVEGEKKRPGDSLGVLAEVAGAGPVLRFGGHATIGLGRARVRLANGGGGR